MFEKNFEDVTLCISATTTTTTTTTIIINIYIHIIITNSYNYVNCNSYKNLSVIDWSGRYIYVQVGVGSNDRDIFTYNTCMYSATQLENEYE